MRMKNLPRLLGLLRQMLVSNDGAAIVEMAFVFIPFMTMISGIFEVSLIAFSNAAMDNALREIGRTTRVNSVKCLTANQFAQKICQSVPFFTNCSDSLKVQRRSYSTNAAGIVGWVDTNETRWDAVQGKAIVIYQARYTWKNIFPFLDDVLGGVNVNNGDGIVLMQSYGVRSEDWGEVENCTSGP